MEKIRNQISDNKGSITNIGKPSAPIISVGSIDEMDAGGGLRHQGVVPPYAVEGVLDSVRRKRSPDDEMLDEINEQQELNQSQVDSDEVDEPEIPKPFKSPHYRVIDDDIQDVLNQYFLKETHAVINSLRIEKDQLEIPIGQDLQISEQFLCIICGNLAIPGFRLGADGIKKESIKLPQC